MIKKRIEDIWVVDPPSEDIARDLHGKDRCSHDRAPCYIRCGVRRKTDLTWEPIPKAERQSRFEDLKQRQDQLMGAGAP